MVKKKGLGVYILTGLIVLCLTVSFVYVVALAVVLSGVRDHSQAPVAPVTTKNLIPATVTPTITEKAPDELKEVKDVTGITTELGWKPVVPESIRWDNLANMYEIQYAASQGKDGKLYDLRSAWINPRVLDPNRAETSSLIKQWQRGIKAPQAFIVSRTERNLMFGHFYIVVDIK